MKTVGVITFHNVPNFGAVLQAWSIVTLIQQLDCRVELINYCPHGHKLKYKRRGIKAFIPSIGTLRRQRFTKTQLPLSPKMTSRHEVAAYVNWRKFDCLVCGSDQIWMKDKFIGFDSTYFLDVGEEWSGRKIAYAPSCGNMQDFGEHATTVKNLLSGFHSLSIRDKGGLCILTRLGLSNVKLVVDPTLLVDFVSFSKRKSHLKTDYLVVTGPMTAESDELVRDVADRLELKVLALGTRCSAANVEKRFVDPAQWAMHIANAKFVVTSLFHGTMLSIRFGRPFIAVGAAGRSYKINDALHRFGIADRLLNPSPDGKYCIKEVNLEMEMPDSNTLLQKEIETSKAYLKEAIHG